MSALTVLVGPPMDEMPDHGSHEDGGDLGVKFTRRFFEAGKKGDYEEAYRCLCRATSLAEDESEDDDEGEMAEDY